jgi:hypothetical protein
MRVLADSTSKALINAPLDSIDITEWLFGLKEEEYIACSSAHIACGTGYSINGKRRSLNIEMIVDNLLVQHYEEEISEAHHCKVNSISDSVSPIGRTKMGVTWELRIKAVSTTQCELSNRVIVFMTPEFGELLASNNITDITAVAGQAAIHTAAHNAEETPLFAKDIEAKALAGLWRN